MMWLYIYQKLKRKQKSKKEGAAHEIRKYATPGDLQQGRDFDLL